MWVGVGPPLKCIKQGWKTIVNKEGVDMALSLLNNVLLILDKRLSMGRKALIEWRLLNCNHSENVLMDVSNFSPLNNVYISTALLF